MSKLATICRFSTEGEDHLGKYIIEKTNKFGLLGYFPQNFDLILPRITLFPCEKGNRFPQMHKIFCDHKNLLSKCGQICIGRRQATLQIVKSEVSKVSLAD